MVETGTYTNTGPAAQEVFLAVGGVSNARGGLFSLDVAIERNYLESTLPTACDDMTGAPPLGGIDGDDDATEIIDLPFPFTFFGERVLEYSVSTNGLVQLWPTLMGTPSTAFDNVPIPTPAEPNGFIAAWWDDLLSHMGARVLTRTRGTAPNRRFVVQWTGYSFYNDNTARMTFQAKLFETSNVIEVHYCSVTPGMNAGFATGSSASVGMESGTGRTGLQHSFNTAMSISTATALRWTP
jgi:hypothetical protein